MDTPILEARSPDALKTPQLPLMLPLGIEQSRPSPCLEQTAAHDLVDISDGARRATDCGN
jgi:hypothetical protein